jgi:hypothetical protein
MNRSDARALAIQILEATGSYTRVIAGPARKFAGVSPVAVVISRGLNLTMDAREEWTLSGDIQVSIYVRCAVDDEAATEDRLDDLVRTAALALRDAGFVQISSDALPESAPLRSIDTVFYRVERLNARMESDEE